MKFEIKNRYNDSIIYSGEGETLAAVVKEAVSKSANLCGANLCGANLCGANLGGANLGGANLCGANLGETFPYWRYRICGEGSVTGWKKLRCGNLLRLEIPADARRVNGLNSRKCRAEYAIVAGVYSKNGDLLENPGELRSIHNSDYQYHVGQECRPDSFSDDVRVECAPGIHFFITFEEAKEYT